MFPSWQKQKFRSGLAPYCNQPDFRQTWSSSSNIRQNFMGPSCLQWFFGRKYRYSTSKSMVMEQPWRNADGSVCADHFASERTLHLLTPAGRRATSWLQCAGAWSSQSTACLQVFSRSSCVLTVPGVLLLLRPVIRALDRVWSILEVMNKAVPPFPAPLQTRVWDYLTI